MRHNMALRNGMAEHGGRAGGAVDDERFWLNFRDAVAVRNGGDVIPILTVKQ
ncbi:hypothetical protein [Streptomyces sp. NPDC001933]|uniref:hypothetical protein n=1 Tax=Streptomyces sp. NPDC001933 TaxID=3364626 RepID=UPI00367C26CE